MKKKSDVVERLLAKINNDPDLKGKLQAKVNLEFSVLDTIHWYLQDRKEYNESHLDDFAEFCIKETVKRGSYLPARMYFNDWMEYTEKEKERLRKELK
jgi:hypothetical protein